MQAVNYFGRLKPSCLRRHERRQHSGCGDRSNMRVATGVDSMQTDLPGIG